MNWSHVGSLPTQPLTLFIRMYICGDYGIVCGVVCCVVFVHVSHSSVALFLSALLCVVAFKVYDIDQDGYISNGELFQVLKTMVGNNLTDKQLQQIVDKTILYADKDGDGKISYEEFVPVREMPTPVG